PDRAGIPDLTARLAVERRAVGDDLDRLPGFRLVQCAIWAENRQHGGLALGLVVPEELRLALRDRGIELGAASGLVLERGAAAARLPLGGHRLLEPDEVDAGPALAGHLDREVNRKAVGVVEPERLLAGDDARGLPLRDRVG